MITDREFLQFTVLEAFSLIYSQALTWRTRFFYETFSLNLTHFI